MFAFTGQQAAAFLNQSGHVYESLLCSTFTQVSTARNSEPTDDRSPAGTGGFRSLQAAASSPGSRIPIGRGHAEPETIEHFARAHLRRRSRS